MKHLKEFASSLMSSIMKVKKKIRKMTGEQVKKQKDLQKEQVQEIEKMHINYLNELNSYQQEVLNYDQASEEFISKAKERIQSSEFQPFQQTFPIQTIEIGSQTFIENNIEDEEINNQNKDHLQQMESLNTLQQQVINQEDELKSLKQKNSEQNYQILLEEYKFNELKLAEMEKKYRDFSEKKEKSTFYEEQNELLSSQNNILAKEFQKQQNQKEQLRNEDQQLFQSLKELITIESFQRKLIDRNEKQQNE